VRIGGLSSIVVLFKDLLTRRERAVKSPEKHTCICLDIYLLSTVKSGKLKGGKRERRKKKRNYTAKTKQKWPTI